VRPNGFGGTDTANNLREKSQPLPSPWLNTVRHPELVGSTQSGQSVALDHTVAQHAPQDNPLSATDAGLITLGELVLGCALPPVAAVPYPPHAGRHTVVRGRAAIPSVSREGARGPLGRSTAALQSRCAALSSQSVVTQRYCFMMTPGRESAKHGSRLSSSLGRQG